MIESIKGDIQDYIQGDLQYIYQTVSKSESMATTVTKPVAILRLTMLV